jgi:hypothetical protein
MAAAKRKNGKEQIPTMAKSKRRSSIVENELAIRYFTASKN